jgi:List-Bact-rpt repeat protein
VFPASHVLHGVARLRLGQRPSILLFALVALGVVVGPSAAPAQQLDLSWVDNSGGEAGFIIQRATGTTGTYAQIGQNPPGTVSYTDNAVSLGTTYCYRVAAADNAGTSAFSNVSCGSPSGGFTIAVADTGTGVGTVRSSPTGIDCGTTCTYTYPGGTVVTLAATPASGSTFIGWSSGGCSGTDPCALAGNGTVTVTATFAALATSTYTLTVNKQGPGTVSSSPGGISCGSLCSASYSDGTVITLTAVPGNNATFTGWNGGGCSGASTCKVTLKANTSVTASFKHGKK